MAAGSTVHAGRLGQHRAVRKPLTYQWTQTGGTRRSTLSSSTAVKPTFTAPANLDGLTFQLVVSNGQANSNATPSSSPWPAPRLGPTWPCPRPRRRPRRTPARARPPTRRSTGRWAATPGTTPQEWATAGGGAGSWLLLTWVEPADLRYDRALRPAQPQRPDHRREHHVQRREQRRRRNPPQQRLGVRAHLSAKTETTLQLNITSVSSTTSNVGLAEIQVYLT